MKTLILALRSLLWTILLPGVVAGYVPWRYFGVSQVRVDPSSPLDLLGIFLIAIGAALLGACIWAIGRRGRGTLSPVVPPKELVVHGLYRYVRNPMYVSVSTIVFGEALLVRSTALIVYWAIFFTAANLFVLLYEEPTLRHQFGESYERYTKQVGRWIPRPKPWRL